MTQTLKRNTLIIMLAALLALVGISTTFAATPTGNSPEQGRVAGTSHSLPPGESVWYAFSYSVEYDEDNKPSPISIWLENAADDATNFEVWTGERLRQWQTDGNDVKAIGRGSESDYTPGDYFWTGEFYEADTYYVKVMNEGFAPSYYTLYIEGKGVHMTANQAEMMEEDDMEADMEVKVTEASAEAEEAVATSEDVMAQKDEAPAQDGSSLENALTANGQWMPLQPGESVWYAFEYTYDDDTQRVSIWLDNEPDNDNINFEVWTTERLHKMQQDGADEVKPVGRGSQNDNMPGDDFWSGEFYQSGTHYVKVTNESLQVNYYALSVEMTK